MSLSSVSLPACLFSVVTLLVFIAAAVHVDHSWPFFIDLMVLQKSHIVCESHDIAVSARETGWLTINPKQWGGEWRRIFQYLPPPGDISTFVPSDLLRIDDSVQLFRWESSSSNCPSMLSVRGGIPGNSRRIHDHRWRTKELRFPFSPT